MRIGVLGGGQLGLMLGQAGAALGCTFTFLEPAEECPAAVTGEWIRADFDDAAALRELAGVSDVVTYEFENVPADAVHAIDARAPVRPSARSLETSQDRLREKEFFRGLDVATACFEPVDDERTLAHAVERIGLPAVLKTRRFGYDGRGQRVLRAASDLAPAAAALGGQPLLLESLVPFDRELSVIGVRALSGECAFYPVVENRHEGGILRQSIAPAPGPTSALQARAEAIARTVMESLGHVGVLAVELFEAGGELLANEMAPRVHNSGHWSIEGAATSQFENHVRAVAGMPLGPTTVRGHWGMVNLIGAVPDLDILRGAGAVHLYGKQPRAGRKLGHVTVGADDVHVVAARVERIRAVAAAGATRPGAC